MNVIDLHPEELLDRARRGSLSADERARLDAHLAHCVACRFEAAVQRDFASAQHALPEVDGLQALVSGALQAAGKTAAPPAAVAPSARGSRARWLLPWAAALVLVSSVAAAQTGLIARALLAASTHVESLLGVRRDAASTKPRAVRRKPVVDSPSASQPAPSIGEVAPDDAPTTPSAPYDVDLTRAPGAPAWVSSDGVKRHRPPLHPRGSASDARAAGASAAPAVPGGVAPAYVPIDRVTTPPAPVVDATPPSSRTAEVDTPAAPAPVQPSASVMFERANRLRRAGQARAAAASYGELFARHPQSPEARLSLVLLGRLELDRGEARAALARFDTYLASGEQALREQALAGRALSLAALERGAEACAAFDALLRAYPSSAYAAKARARCTEN